jgi:hypothetical protein
MPDNTTAEYGKGLTTVRHALEISLPAWYYVLARRPLCSKLRVAAAPARSSVPQFGARRIPPKDP